MELKDVISMDLTELEKEVVLLGEKSYRAAQIYRWIHEKLCDGFDEMTNISESFRERCKETFSFPVLKAVERLESAIDGTCKFLFELSDKNVIESVLMKYHHGNSVCISSQAGCRMGCRFCASTLNGLTRNLAPSEMLEQVYRIQKISGQRVSNIVVMGTGEPLDNYDYLVKFIRMISSENGLNISQRNITVSTCGIPENISRLAEEGLGINLALSLHAPNDTDREVLMPVARQYKLKDVLSAMDKYYQKTKRRLTFEYSLVAGVNDSAAQAEQLAKLVFGKNCLVNLIPVNDVKERGFFRPNTEKIQKFKNILEKNRIHVTIRREMGADINAACGQLRKSYADKRKQQEVSQA